MKEHIKPCICKTCLKAIKKLLQSQTQELRKKVEGMRKESPHDAKGFLGKKLEEGCFSCQNRYGYNQALSDILDAIK